MWNSTSSNKMSKAEEVLKNFKQHKQNLATIKPIINIQSPYQPVFIFTKPKLEMSRRDRLIEIDKQNRILLSKLDKIYDHGENIPREQVPKHLKCYDSAREKIDYEQKMIDNENKRICGKLLRVKSHYQTKSIISQTDKLNRIGFGLSQNARRVKSQSRLSLTRPGSASSYSKFVRSGRKSQKENVQCQDIRAEERVGLLEKKGKNGLRPGSAPSVRVSSTPVEKKVLEESNGNEDYEEQIMI